MRTGRHQNKEIVTRSPWHHCILSVSLLVLNVDIRFRRFVKEIIIRPGVLVIRVQHEFDYTRDMRPASVHFYLFGLLRRSIDRTARKTFVIEREIGVCVASRSGDKCYCRPPPQLYDNPLIYILTSRIFPLTIFQTLATLGTNAHNTTARNTNPIAIEGVVGCPTVTFRRSNRPLVLL